MVVDWASHEACAVGSLLGPLGTWIEVDRYKLSVVVVKQHMHSSDAGHRKVGEQRVGLCLQVSSWVLEETLV